MTDILIDLLIIFGCSFLVMASLMLPVVVFFAIKRALKSDK